MNLICFVIAAVLFFLLGFHVIDPSSKLNLDEVGWGFLALGLALGSIALPVVWRRP